MTTLPSSSRTLLMGLLFPSCPLLLGCVSSSGDPLATDSSPAFDADETSTSMSGYSEASTLDVTSPNDSTTSPGGSSSTSSSGELTTGEDPEDTSNDGVCGDGVINDDEACDNGDDNSNNGECLEHCEYNHCGDGYVYLGVEDCDDGNTDNSDSCLDTCAAASCGDGFLHAGVEECEGDDIDMTEGNVCQDCAWVPVGALKLVFISGVRFHGNFHPSPEFLGDYELADFPTTKTGVARADERCQTLAELANLDEPSAFRAWISDNNGQPESDAIDRLQPESQGAYVLPGGPMVAESLQDLLSNGPMHSIDRTEQGESILGDVIVWSNTNEEGTNLDLLDPENNPTSCEDWHTETPELKGQVGLAEKDVVNPSLHWTDAGLSRPCSEPLRIYCFQQ